MARFCKIFFLLLFLSVSLTAQYDNPSSSLGQSINFEHLAVEQGLSQNNITCILQDTYGFLWIGTEDGLNKYDGYKFTVFRHDPDDSSSLKSNWITSLYEDQSGVLWITTLGAGLFRFDRKKENFIHFKPPGLATTTIEQVVKYQNGTQDILWIAGYTGLFKIDLTTLKCIHYPHTDKGTPYDWILSMEVDPSGNVWIGTRGDGLHKFDPETEQYIHNRHDLLNPSGLNSNHITALHMDKSGILWIGTEGGGLNKFDPENNHFVHYQHDPGNLNSLSSNNILSIFEDKSGLLWVGTMEEGLNRFDRKTAQFTHVKANPGIENKLSDNTVVNIYEDNTGVLWIGTYDGLNKFDPNKTEFSSYKKIPGDTNSLCDNYITSIYESTYRDKKLLWVGTKNGLNIIDRLTGRVTSYQHDHSNASSIPSNKISSIFEDRSGTLWIGTLGDGLIKFNLNTKKFTQYSHDYDDPYSIRSNVILDVYEDKYGVLWIGTTPNGLSKFNRKTEKFISVGVRKRTMQIFEDKKGELWFATWPGLRKFDWASSEFEVYWRNREALNYPELNRHNCIHESRFGEKNILWVGSYNGLNKFDRNSGVFFTYSVEDGLPNNVINGILEDNQGNLWLSTNNGLSRFNYKTEEFRNFDVNDGLLSNQFYPGACYKSKDGEMFYGSAKGLISFYPDRLIQNPDLPNILITDFKLFNEPVLIKKEDNDNRGNIFSLPIHISLLNEIVLSYSENVFSFEFAALDYHSPQKNQYAYKMEGVDPEWVHTDASRRFATYTNLDPGEYTFTVKGSNNDGVWNEEGTSIKVIITPPWWQTNLAYMFYVFFVGLIVLGFWRFQINRLRIKQQMEMQNFEAEKLREVDKLKTRFFANISHEFRTPLTLIKGPVKQIMDGEFTGNLKQKCKMILRNSDRLLGLINQILDLSKLESGEIKLQVAETDIIKYFKGIVLSFSSLAESKKVDLNFTSSENSLMGYVDRDKLEKIVTNLLSNAFKFTPEGGVVEVSIPPLPAASALTKGGTRGVEIVVSNTGPHIPPDQLKKIFDRFYSAPLDRNTFKDSNGKTNYPTGHSNNNYKKDGEGTGIGLALTKELVEVCHGDISVSSIPNKNTTFVVSIPITKDCFQEDEIVESTPQISPLTKGGLRGVTESIQETTNFRGEEPISQNHSPGSGLPSPLLLIVEDNPDVTSYICSFMENDFRLITAENGKIGLKKTLDKYPDLIISDVMMPEMDGFELCQKIKSDERISHIPVILLTAKADLNSKIEGLEFGADDYINKPFEADELKVRLKNLIEQRKKLREKFTRLIELQPNEITVTSIDEDFLKRLMTTFEIHISEPDFSTEQCAKEIGMSRSSLNRKLQALTNNSTHDFIRTLRLKRAAQLLKKAGSTVAEIAYSVGFNNTSHFAKAFRQHFGQSPSDFINKNSISK